MSKPNLLQDKSLDFALRIVVTCKNIMDEKDEFVLSEQLLKSGTFIGASVEAALSGHNRPDYFTHISEAYKHAKQTLYWLKLLAAANYIEADDAIELSENASELCRIIGSIQKNNVPTDTR